MTRTTALNQQVANKIELEALEKSMAESPEEKESDKYTALDGLVESDKPSTLIIDGVEFLDGKRRVKSKPKCNLPISSGHWYSVANPLSIVKDIVDIWVLRVGQHFRLKPVPPPPAAKPALETSSYREILERYRVEFPQSEIAENEIFGRKSRNASAKFGDAKLASLRAYIDLHRTIEPNRSLWSAGVARSDKQEHGPTPEKLAEIWSDPSIKYETRMVGYYPHHRREMKIPTSGPVLYFGVPEKTSQQYEKQSVAEDVARNTEKDSAGDSEKIGLPQKPQQ